MGTDKKSAAGSGPAASDGGTTLAGSAAPKHSTQRAGIQYAIFSPGSVRPFWYGRPCISSTAHATPRPGQRRITFDFDDLDTLRRKRIPSITVRCNGVAYRARMCDIWRYGRPVRGGWSFPLARLYPVALKGGHR